MRFNLFLLSTAIWTLTGFLGCATQSSEPSLTLPNAPATLKVGDTITTSPATEKKADLTGRMTTNATFTNYVLTVDDTAIMTVYGLKLVGKNQGTTTFTATANDGSGLVSAKYSVLVKPAVLVLP